MSFACPVQPENKKRYDEYLSKSLGRPVELIGASQLSGGFSNNVLWRLNVVDGGMCISFVLKTAPSNRDKIIEEAYPYNIRLEFCILRKLESIAPPTPKVWGLDEEGKALGIPCFVMEFIQGEPLMGPLFSGELWAEELYLDTVCALQAITRTQLGSLAQKFGEGCDALGHLMWAAERFPRYTIDPFVSKVHARLKELMPLNFRGLPPLEPRFGNGDLNPMNMLIKDRELAGVIDFEFAGFSDPMFEFMSPIRWYPQMRNRGLEERFCERNGFDLDIIEWYRALVLFGTWLGMLAIPRSEREGCTAVSCRQELEQWVETF